MSMLATREVRKNPPQAVPRIIRAHRLSRGLIYAGGAGIAPPGSTDGSAYFTRTNGLLANVAQAAGSMHGYFTGDVPDIRSTAFGPALYFDGTRKVYTQSIVGPANGAAPDETCLVICSLGSSSGSQHIFGYGSVWSTSLADYGRGIGIEGGQLLAWGASATNGKKIGVTLPALNVPVVLAARFSGPSSPGGTGAVFVNGAKAGSGDMSHAWSYYLAAGSGVAAIESQELANFTGLIGLRLWWRRGLNDEEILSISQNPWQIFSNPEAFTFPSTSGTSTRTVTPSGGIEFGGASSYARVRALSSAGGLQFGGEAAVSFVGLQTRVVTPSGGLEFGGAAAKAAVRQAAAPSGGVQFGGVASVILHESVRTVTPSGGIEFGGAAYVYIPALASQTPYQKFIYGRKGLATRKYR